MQLCFDFDKVKVEPVILPHRTGKQANSARAMRGSKAYESGRLAELAVCDFYIASGYRLVARRWRGKAGEIDVIMRSESLFVFVEVKSSRDFVTASQRISPSQIQRICMAACEFCGNLPTGESTDMRMDAALVDQFGRVKVIEAAFGAD